MCAFSVVYYFLKHCARASATTLSIIVTRELSLMLNREDVPHIVIGKPDFPKSLCWIDNNNQLAGELAARHLLERGIKKIAFIGGCETDKISEDRLAGRVGRLKTWDLGKS